MSIALATKYAPFTDEIFKDESKVALVTNQDYDWTGAHTVKVYKISTAALNDYNRNHYAGDEGDDISRFGKLYDLNATTEEQVLNKDRSFIFNLDLADMDETAGQLEAEKALAREIREVVMPEIDKYVYGKMVTGAGTTADAAAIDDTNVYGLILDGSEALDNAEVPEDDRVLIVSPKVYKSMKEADIFDNNDVGAEARMLGAVAMLDGMAVIRVPATRLPAGFGFMLAHPSATVLARKLDDFGIHENTPLSSGTIVTGRFIYDAFVLDNKAKGIYYQPATNALSI